MHRKKILYVHHNSKDIGGADYCLFKLVLEMKKAGNTPLLLLATDSAICDLYKKQNIPVRVVLVKRPKNDRFNGILYLYRLVNEILFLYRYMKTERIDLVHSNDLLDFSANIATRLAGIKSCQHIRTILNYNRPSIKIASRFIHCCADRLFCVSRAVQSHMFPYDQQKCRIIHDWHDFDAVEHNTNRINLRKQIQLAPDSKLIGWIGRSVSWKGQHLFLEAIPEVVKHRSNTHFIVVSGKKGVNDSYCRQLEHAYERKIIKAHVTVLGYRTEIASIMDQLDIVVNSSITPDPFPGVVLEALYSGKIVVAPRAGGIKEQIIDTVTGFLFRPDNSKDLANKLHLALESLDQNHQMGKRAKQDVEKRFYKEKIIKKLIANYCELLQ